ncbi:membrane-associated protein [Solirubrobacter pauli]|uniref:Membrane-associated protein n=1 Tax=Solirubrobacter pauli TaxID=166793 RepID=A0A660L3I0_9ACTN|nr:DedA family protein [Solirubrobacter pauli]RKQ87875.1 membrane-associated protein [Solirubrobacter pauli]
MLPDVGHLLTEAAQALGSWTYLLVGGLAFGETGAGIGLVVPGETAVVLGGVVAAKGEVSLPAILLVAWIASFLGDLTSFLLGRRLGRPFLYRHGPRVKLSTERLERVEGFFDRHGSKAIVVGRFVGIVRAVCPFLAGASKLPLRSFVPYSLAGTAVWASAFTLAGYSFHRSFEEATKLLSHGALVLGVLAALAFAIAHQRGRRRTRASRPAR